jgi:hypothetical protein
MPEEPNVEGSIGVGLDTWPNFDIGDPDNNHVSLHFNGTPIKAVGIDPADLNLEDNAWHSAVLKVDLVTGSVQFSIDGTTYIDEVLFGLSPCVQLRPAFYARTGGAYNDHDLDNIRAETRAEGLPPTFLDESFDTTTLPFNGWEWGVEVSARGYVEGDGVGGSRAIQMSGHFIDWGGFAMACYEPSVECNGSATRSTTRMSFDVKTDVPGRQLSVGLTSWKDNLFGGAVGFMVGDIPLAPTNPGEFQTIDICLGSPIWHFPQWDPNITEMFDPSGGTIGVYFQAEAWNFGGVGSSVTVTVDNLRFYTVPEIPEIQHLKASPAILWPPNHKMVEVAVDYALDIGCHQESDVSTTITVASNERANGLGDGDTSPDWEVVDAHRVRLRAERSGKGTGRIYTITLTCADKEGHVVSRQVSVSVPRNK